jgi:hypothetical protein
MNNYHAIMQSVIAEKSWDEIHNELAREHNKVLAEFSRSPRLQKAAAAALQIKQSALDAARAKESCLLSAVRSETSWSAAGGHEAALNAEGLRHELRILMILTGGDKHRGSSDGYVLWPDAMRALVA